MIRDFAYKGYRAASQALRQTPLRHVAWIGRLHTWLYGRFGERGALEVGPFHIHVDPRDRVIAKKLALYGAYEGFEIEILRQFLSPGGVMIDIGANIGLYSLWASRAVGANGHVWAFEPDPGNFVLLERNLRENDCVNTHAVQKGLANVAGTVRLYQSAENRGHHSMRNITDGDESVDVEVTTLDAFLADRPEEIQVIKMDIEGAEPLAFAAMTRTLERNPRVKLLLEYAPSYIEAFDQNPLEFLRSVEKRFALSLVDEIQRKLVPMAASALDATARKSTFVNILAIPR